MIFNMAGGGGIELDSIAITTPPTKASGYFPGEVFDSTGMVVTATYSDGTTAEVTGYSISPKTLNAGTTSVTVSVTECRKTVTAAQSVSVIDLSIPDNVSWAKVSEIAQAGQAENYWSVGDCKAVEINGTVGTLSVSGTFYVYIIGFNHNGATNAIDFGMFKTAASGGISVFLDDSKNGDTSENGAKYFNMNHSADTSSGGWAGCDLRYDVLGSTKTKGGDAATDTATNPVSGTLMAALPSDLRAVMKPMTVHTDNTGDGSNTGSHVTASVDYLPLLAEFEISGKRTYANSAEQNYQAQYAYYAAGNSAVKYKNSDKKTASYWWSRSPKYNDDSSFLGITTNGDLFGISPRSIIGIAPIFRV